MRIALVIPPKAAYDGPNDVTMVLVGPGLPLPTQAVPEGLPPGDGAIFAEINPDQGPFPLRNFLGNWYGPNFDINLPATGRFQIRVYSPSDWRGEYILTSAGNDPNAGTLEDTKLPTPGDINQDGKVDTSDAVQGLIIALGVEPVENTFALMSGDVAPPGDPDRFLVPGDGVIDLSDVTRILRRAVGLDTSPDWPD
jgi:hypothetical protein